MSRQSDRDGSGRADEPESYGVMLALCLPRDALSVPVIRHLVRYALEEVGVVDEVSRDIEIALAEACTNVLDHSGPGDAYEVSVRIGRGRCELRVVDVGHGFDHDSIVRPAPAGGDLTAERGRGLGLMRALVDDIEFVSAPEEGTLVRLVKQLVFDENAPAQRLLFQALHRDPFSGDGEPYPLDPSQPTTALGLSDAVPDLD